MKKPSKSFEIALSAIACAFAAAFLMLGTLDPFLLATGYLVATFALMVPLSKGFVWGASLCYLAAGLLALPVGFLKVVPYFVFFGLHPIANYLQRRFVKRPLLHGVLFVLKAAWFDLSLWLSFYVLNTLVGMPFPELVTEYLYWAIFLGGTLFFAAYDIMIFYCQKSADALIRRIRR